MENNTIIKKNGFCFSKTNENQYITNFEIKSENLDLSKLLNFDIMKLIYDLNPDLIADCKIDKITDSKARFAILFKPFFKDIGIPQKFVHVEITQQVHENKIIFFGHPIKDRPSFEIPPGCIQLPAKQMRYECNIINMHHVIVTQLISLDATFKIKPFIEKFLGNILIKIFTRVKQFIENFV